MLAAAFLSGKDLPVGVVISLAISSPSKKTMLRHGPGPSGGSPDTNQTFSAKPSPELTRFPFWRNEPLP
jgi:hypothetical protein